MEGMIFFKTITRTVFIVFVDTLPKSYHIILKPGKEVADIKYIIGKTAYECCVLYNYFDVLSIGNACNNSNPVEVRGLNPIQSFSLEFSCTDKYFTKSFFLR